MDVSGVSSWVGESAASSRPAAFDEPGGQPRQAESSEGGEHTKEEVSAQGYCTGGEVKVLDRPCGPELRSPTLPELR
jgi:hypothetical protein